MAFREDIITISKADDGGYIVDVRVKMKKKRESKDEICCAGGRFETKTMVAKDVDEVKTFMDKLLPDMKPGGMEEDEFNKAFKEFVKEDE
jgi:hypothetical protein